MHYQLSSRLVPLPRLIPAFVRGSEGIRAMIDPCIPQGIPLKLASALRPDRVFLPGKLLRCRPWDQSLGWC